MKKMYCLVVTDNYSRFTRIFFLATKDETSGILKSFITRIENIVDHKVKVIRCDNGTKFKNGEMNQFCEMKGILRQFNVARTPQQDGVAKRRNMTLIKAVRTMLADSKLPTTFLAEANNTDCYRTPYRVSFMRPFGCPVTILNTIDHLGKFDGKADEGFFIGYSLNRSGPDWLFDIDALTRTMNYEPIVLGTQSNGFIGTKASDNAGQARKKTESVKDYILLPLWTTDPPFSQDPKSSHDDGSKPSSDDGKKVDEDLRKDSEYKDQAKEDNVNSTNNVNAASTIEVNVVGAKTSIELPFDPNMPTLEDISIFDFLRDDEDDDAETDMNNLDITIQVNPNPTIGIHKDHPLDQVIGYFQSATQTRRMSKNLKEHGFVSTIQQRTNHKDLQNCLFACFLSQEEPKKVIHALKDPSWIEDVQEELLQFKLQEVWTLKEDGMFISQDKYVTEILKKFGFTDVKTASTPMETQNILLKDEDVNAARHNLLLLLKVNAARHNLLLLLKVNAARHNLLLLLKVNAARHNLLLLLKVNVARHNLLLLLKVNAARHKLTTVVES
ncbi:putative ribonuclease H-like domain-containing protein [Tanacetum coccineum]